MANDALKPLDVPAPFTDEDDEPGRTSIDKVKQIGKSFGFCAVCYIPARVAFGEEAAEDVCDMVHSVR